MKFLLHLALVAIFSFTAQSLLVDPKLFFTLVNGQPLSLTNLKKMLNSPVVLKRIARYHFEQQDVNISGRLNLSEFTEAYKTFFAALLGPFAKVTDNFAQKQFKQADFIIRNMLIGVDEFTFITSTLVALVHNNYDKLVVNPQEDAGIATEILSNVNSIFSLEQGILEGLNIEDLFSLEENQTIGLEGIFTGLQNLKDIIGLDISYTPRILYDMINMYELNEAEELSKAELKTFIEDILGNIHAFLSGLI